MIDLLQNLRNDGWVIKNECLDPNYSSNLFHVIDDAVIWGVMKNEKSIELEFRLFNSLGKRTSNLKDILYCVANSSFETKLYFEKRSSNTWQTDRNDFIRKLNHIL
jgi:hypothetical protein